MSASQSAVASVTIDADDAWWPPTLSSSSLRPLAVREVDDPDRQPEHTSLDRRQRIELHAVPDLSDRAHEDGGWNP
jgi:hypothetical protein